MTTLVLVRHASHDLVGKALAGRSSSVRLNEAGRREARSLAASIGGMRARAVCVSPQVRALETAQPLADRLGIAPRVDASLDEIDFGLWTGLTFEALACDPLWPAWVERRGSARPPQGEAFAHVQERIVGYLGALQTEYPQATVIVISHGDVLKAALAHYLRVSLDHLEGFDLRPASLSIVTAQGSGAQVRAINWTAELPAQLGIASRASATS